MAQQILRRIFKYRLYPTDIQVERLEATLEVCCELYNASLQERRDAYRIERKSVRYAEQANQLPGIRCLREDVASVHSQVLQEVLRRVEKAFDSFFRRSEAKQKAGFPRFRSKSRYDSFTFPQSGFALKGSKLKLSKIGCVKIKLHRSLEGRVKTLTIKRESGRWYACFSLVCEPQVLPACESKVGIDVGLSAFATLSDGTKIENPRWHQKAQSRLRRAQRKVARRKKGSRRRLKAVQILARIHNRIRNQRSDFHHKLSCLLVNNFGLISVERLNICGLARGILAKSVTDAGWSGFFEKIRYKAACAGRVFIEVNPNDTTQSCSQCGQTQPKTLSQRWHLCESCGLSISRDHNAALNILRLGLSLHAPTVEVLNSRRCMRSRATYGAE